MSRTIRAPIALDFGPPRLVYGWEAWHKEISRQRSLISAGYIRRWRGITYGWQEAEMSAEGHPWCWQLSDDGRSVCRREAWHWSSSNCGYLPSAHEAFEDHDRAWDDRVKGGDW